MLTGAVPDSGPQPSGTFSTLGWTVIAVKPSGRRGGQQGHAVTRFLTKIHKKTDVKTTFLTSCLKFKKIRRIFLQE
jgi:hypothetical protein